MTTYKAGRARKAQKPHRDLFSGRRLRHLKQATFTDDEIHEPPRAF
jgi:hypothetical protein